MDANKRVTCYIIYELLLIKVLRLMSAFNDNLFIFFVLFYSTHPIHPHPPSPLPPTIFAPESRLPNSRIRFYLDISSQLNQVATCLPAWKA